TGAEIRAFPKDGRGIRSVAFTPDGKTVAAAGSSIRMFDPTTGTERYHIDRKATALHFSADGKTLTAAVAGAIHRWEAATGQPLTPQSGCDSVVVPVIASADGRRLVTRGQDGDAQIWDVQTGKLLRHVNVSWQRGLALSPDGRYLAWSVVDESIKYTDAAMRNVIIT